MIRIINMLFNDNKIQEMLIDKNNDLYKYFPRIFNEWEMIKLNGKDEIFKSYALIIPPILCSCEI